MFKFVQITYEELQEIISSYKWGIPFHLIDRSYIKGCEKILDSSGNLIAMIYYYYEERFEYFMISQFEVLEKYRRLGYGKSIIKEFANNHKYPLALLLLDDESEKFWLSCGFVYDGPHYGLFHYL